MDVDLRDLYDLETVIAESLLIESKDLDVAVWVSGTKGLEDHTFTLEVQLLVPEPLHQQFERKVNTTLEFEDLDPEIEDIQPYEDVDQFIKDSLEGSSTGEQIREWCRYYSVHNNPLGMGLCPTMDKHDYDRWVLDWRSKKYSNEGQWVGGAERHIAYNEECPWCAARFKKGIATGSPEIPAPVMSKEERKAKLRSRFGGLGRACGDPVRPLSFRVSNIGIEGSPIEVRGKKNTKPWFSERYQDLAQILLRRYRSRIVNAVDQRLNIPKDSPLYQLVFGVTTKKDPVPSNWKMFVIDKNYVAQNMGRVPELQALIFNSYSPDAPGPSFTQWLSTKGGKDVRETKSYIDLTNLETHFIYNYVIEIFLDQSTISDWPKADAKIELDDPDVTELDDAELALRDAFPSKTGAPGAPLTQPNYDTFINRLESIIDSSIDEAKFHGYWVDRSNNVFSIMKIETGLTGLNFLIDPFLPMKKHELEQLKDINPKHYKMMKLLPSISPAWYMGGRAEQIALDRLNDYLVDRYGMTLAPYDQFKPYPIGPDGSIYFIREDDMLVLEDDTHVVGRIVEESEESTVIEQLVLTSSQIGEKADITYQDRRRSDRKIRKKLIKVNKENVVDRDKVSLDDRDFMDLTKDKFSSGKIDELITKQQAHLDYITPSEEYIDTLRERYGEKFVDKLGVIDPEEPGEVYEWTDPRLWSRDLIRRLSTPREYIDRTGSLFRKDQTTGEFSCSNPGDTYAWAIIEDRLHPDTPYVYSSEGEYVHVLDDDEFQRKLLAEGMFKNPINGQWEARIAFPFFNANGCRRVKWLRFNEAAFWLHAAGKSYQDSVSFQRDSASTGKIIENLSADPSKVEIGLSQWTKEWIRRNNRRILSERLLFPSPYKMLNPPTGFWENQIVQPPNYSKQSSGFKKYWPCRECEGVGCDRCTPDEYVEEYDIKTGVLSDDPLQVQVGRKFRYRDLWTGREWLSYLSALFAWDKTKSSKDKTKYGPEQIKQLFVSLYRSYDLHCLQKKIKREKGQPMDLSGLTDNDRLMILANWKGAVPKTQDQKRIDDFLTGMTAIYTELYYRVMPPEFREFVFKNTKDGGLFRPDLYIDQVSNLEEYNNTAREMSFVSPEDRKRLELVAQRRRDRRAAKALELGRSGVKEQQKKQISLWDKVEEPESIKEYDPEEDSLEAQSGLTREALDDLSQREFEEEEREEKQSGTGEEDPDDIYGDQDDDNDDYWEQQAQRERMSTAGLSDDELADMVYDDEDELELGFELGQETELEPKDAADLWLDKYGEGGSIEPEEPDRPTLPPQKPTLEPEEELDVESQPEFNPDDLDWGGGYM